MANPRKKYLLRIPQELYDVFEAWAADEFRSVNAQIEVTLVDAARSSGRLGRSKGRSSDEPKPSKENPE